MSKVKILSRNRLRNRKFKKTIRADLITQMPCKTILKWQKISLMLEAIFNPLDNNKRINTKTMNSQEDCKTKQLQLNKLLTKANLIWRLLITHRTKDLQSLIMSTTWKESNKKSKKRSRKRIKSSRDIMKYSKNRLLARITSIHRLSIHANLVRRKTW